MQINNDIRHGRHCVFNMHVHLVFVAKYRHKVFDSDAISRLKELFAEMLLFKGWIVVAQLLCRLLWRRTDQHHSAIH